MDGINSNMLLVFGLAAFLGGSVLTFTSIRNGGGQYRPLANRLVVSAVTGIVMAVIAMLVYVFVALN